MAWEKDKPRQPKVQEKLNELKELAKQKGLYVYKYQRQSVHKLHPRMNIYMVHDQPEKPSRTKWCKGPGVAWFLDKGPADRPDVVKLLERTIGSLRAELWDDYHQEVLGKKDPRIERLIAKRANMGHVHTDDRPFKVQVSKRLKP